MLNTPIGDLLITVNEIQVPIQYMELPKRERNFVVDKRYRVSVNLLSELPQKIDCFFQFDQLITESSIESGEDLELISFYVKNLKVSLGTLGDIDGISYNYQKNGIRIINNYAKLAQIIYGVAWKTISDSEKEDIFTWFAADPTLF